MRAKTEISVSEYIDKRKTETKEIGLGREYLDLMRRQHEEIVRKNQAPNYFCAGSDQFGPCNK